MKALTALLLLPTLSLAQVVKPSVKLTPALERYCKKIESSFTKYKWGDSHCRDLPWNHVRNSVWGDPLIWMAYGEEKDLLDKSVTIIMCGVHGDEITPIKFCFDIIQDIEKAKLDFKKTFVIVAPIVSPDSFFKKVPTRTNANGVDVNRNFPTKDWKADALRLWKTTYKSNKRRFPGHRALSEPEVLFQMNLVKRYKPDKIISVHSPLTLLDYDGPDLNDHDGIPAKELLMEMSKKADDYKVSNYPHFPGSLGNWAGQELGIPTYTLELPDSDAKNHEKFWNQFRDSIRHAIQQPLAEPPTANQAIKQPHGQQGAEASTKAPSALP